MDLKEYIGWLKRLNGDSEKDHIRADHILCEAILGTNHPDAKELVEAFNALPKWYS